MGGNRVVRAADRGDDRSIVRMSNCALSDEIEDYRAEARFRGLPHHERFSCGAVVDVARTADEGHEFRETISRCLTCPRVHLWDEAA
jgi:hypothetical protein